MRMDFGVLKLFCDIVVFYYGGVGINLFDWCCDLSGGGEFGLCIDDEVDQLVIGFFDMNSNFELVVIF